MKNNKISVASVVLFFGLCGHAQAQIAVIDSSVLGQAIQQAATAVSQLTQLQNQLQTQLAMIKSLPQDLTGGIGNIGGMESSLTQQIVGLQNNISGIQSQMQSLYPSQANGDLTPEQTYSQVQGMQSDVQNSYQAAQEAAAQAVQTQKELTAQTQAAGVQSSQAVGQLQAEQAGNEMLSSLSNQLQALNDSQAAMANASAQEKAEQVAEQAADEKMMENTSIKTYSQMPETQN